MSLTMEVGHFVGELNQNDRDVFAILEKHHAISTPGNFYIGNDLHRRLKRMAAKSIEKDPEKTEIDLTFKFIPLKIYVK